MMKTIRFDRDGAVGRIVLAKPPQNYLDRRFCECLASAVHEASESDIKATSCHMPVARPRNVSHVKAVKRIRISYRIRIIFQDGNAGN